MSKQLYFRKVITQILLVTLLPKTKILHFCQKKINSSVSSESVLLKTSKFKINQNNKVFQSSAVSLSFQMSAVSLQTCLENRS